MRCILKPPAARAAALLYIVLACMAATASCPSKIAWAEEPASVSTFDDSYTAWSGYATTAAQNAVAGAVPVTARAVGDAAWSASTAGDDASSPAIALRQRGQATYAYVAEGAKLTQYDAATGAAGASVQLPASALGCAAFVESALAIPLQSGRVALYDEDLNASWTSEAADVPSGGGAGWTSCSNVVSGKGCLFVTFNSYSKHAGTVLLAAFSQVDGSLLWQTQLAQARSGGRGRACAPSLFYSESAGALLATDGGDGLYLVDAQSGEVRDACAVAGAGDVVRAVAVVGGDEARYVVAGSDGSVCAATVEGGKIVLGDVLDMGVDVATCAPVQAGELVLLGGADGAVHAVKLGADGTSLGLADMLDLGAAPTALLTASMGENARSMDLLVYAALQDGGVARATCSGTDIASAKVAALQKAAGAAGFSMETEVDPGASLVLNRDGMLLWGTPGSVVAFAPDADHAVATPVGGSNGLDTLGASLAGITLPNGVGLGAGVLVFVLAFGAYAAIRGGGGKSSRDEGLDAWRERGDTDDAGRGARSHGGRR